MSALPQRQTIGGIVAARADSLRRLAWGSVRDSLLGVTVINDQGERVKGGGKVVKNVAGYDLPKLYCGSLGTLGLIVEVTFKVAPLPEASATVLLPLDAQHNTEDVLDKLLGSDLAPSFLFLLNPDAAREIVPGAEDAQYVVVGFDGNSEAVAWQVKTLGAGACEESAAADVRARLRDFALNAAPMTAAFHILSSQVGAFSRMVEWTARRAGFTAQVAADAALGLMTAHFAPLREEADWMLFYADLKDKADRCGGSFILTRMPEEFRQHDIPVWSPLLPDFALMARLKETFDPSRMWNPGRFAGRNLNMAVLSPNQMQKAVERGQAPKGIERVDKGNPDLFEQPHVHIQGGAALNKDGTWKHGNTHLTEDQKKWLQDNEWSLPE